jgi:hypothetical protein
MDDTKLIQMIGSALGGGAIAGALLLILYRVTSRIVDRFIAAIDRIAASVAEVRETMVRVEAKLDFERDSRERAPIAVDEPPPARRSPRTNPHGYRSLRSGSEHDD